jgi:hypothetical protein
MLKAVDHLRGLCVAELECPVAVQVVEQERKCACLLGTRNSIVDRERRVNYKSGAFRRGDISISLTRGHYQCVTTVDVDSLCRCRQSVSTVAFLRYVDSRQRMTSPAAAVRRRRRACVRRACVSSACVRRSGPRGWSARCGVSWAMSSAGWSGGMDKTANYPVRPPAQGARPEWDVRDRQSAATARRGSRTHLNPRAEAFAGTEVLPSLCWPFLVCSRDQLIH